MRHFFFSHSSHNKPFVTAVADQVGRDHVWLDQWELSPGDRLFESIDAALGEARAVVVFWSENAAQSPWVNEETSFTRYRRLQGEDVIVIPIRMDDTPFPNWMARLLWIDGAKGAAFVAGQLRDALAEQRPTETVGVDAAFQNRSEECDFIEECYGSPDCTMVLVAGPPGMGKSALVNHALETRLPQQRSIVIDLEAYNSPSLALAVLAGRLGRSFPSDILTGGRWIEYWRRDLLPVLDLSKTTVVLDGLQSVAERGELSEWMSAMIADLTRTPKGNSLPLIAVSSIAIQIPATAVGSTRTLNLGALHDSDIVRVIRHRLATSYPRRSASSTQLEAATQIVQGYPLGAHVWSAHAAQVGLDVAIRDKTVVERHLRDVVSDILSQANLSDDEIEVLATVGLLRLPVGAEQLVDFVGVSSQTLTRLSRLCLFDPRADGVALHGLLAKYLVENLAPHRVVREAHRRLGYYFKARWQADGESLNPQVVIAGSQAYYHLSAAGLADEAANIGWSLIDEATSAARELYRFGDYETLIALGEAAASMSTKVDPQLRFYHALALGRQDAEADRSRCKGVFEELINDYPTNRHYMTGYADILARWRENEAAKELYRKARAIAGKRDPLPSTRLGELLLREGDLAGATFFLEEARKRAPDDLRVMAALAQLLHEQGKTEEALQLVTDGLRRRPDDIPLNHRAGVLLKSLDQSKEAIRHFKRAATGRTSPASYTALADLYLDIGDIDAAERVMNQYPGSQDSSCFNVLGHIARRRQEFGKAEKLFERCRRMDGDSVVIYGSLAQLFLDQAAIEVSYGLVEQARAHISQLEDALLRGLDMDPQNSTLLRLKGTGEDLRRRLLQGPR
ncbi:MAG: TIR domain-containing protein [Alphaproteobacteria bacterium]|nr:TIR domain-containing protein [Alphaproteobacteria bacterium]